MDYRDVLLARADELMRNAPGQVAVRRNSHIDEVRVLREARAALTEGEERDLSRVRLELMERLDGVQSHKRKRPGDEHGLFRRLLDRAAQNMSQAMRPAPDYDYLAREDAKPLRTPVPLELLDAAEAWALSHLVADRVDVDLTILRREWDQASVD